jgi:hypothetical protein
MDRARATVTTMRVGHAVLFEINRKEVHVKPRKPFDSRMQDDTWIPYKDMFRKLCFIRRTDDQEGNRQPYQFRNGQGGLYDAFGEAAQGGIHGPRSH